MLRTEILHFAFKVNERERAALQKVQEVEARPFSEILRESLRDYAKARNLWPTVDQPEQLHQDQTKNS